MHTRSAKSKETGQFHVEVIDWNGKQFAEGWFYDLHKADQFAAEQERAMTVKMQAGDAAPLTMSELLMSDDELLAELTA